MAKKTISIPWDEIDTVLLDMDGTLLDFHHERYLWREKIPAAYAKKNNMTFQDAVDELTPRFMRERPTVRWGNISFWEKKLGLNIWDLKYQDKHLLFLHPHTVNFLKFIKRNNKRTYIVTSADRKEIDIELGHTKIAHYFDGFFSAVELGHSKFDQRFWKKVDKKLRLNGERTLVADDDEDTLHAAKNHGVKWLVFKGKYHSKEPPKFSKDFISVRHFDDIIPGRR